MTPGRRWIAPVAMLALAACSVIPRYPNELPALQAVDERLGRAPDIRGHYADRGEGFTPSSRAAGPASLTAMLNGGSEEPRADSVAVTLGNNGTLELRSLHGTDPVAVVRRSAGSPGDGGRPSNYIGVRGFVVLALEAQHSGAAGVGAAFGDESLWLRKASDGSLIVLHRVLFGGMIAVLPFGGRIDTWYRFALVDAPLANGAAECFAPHVP
jgi:hypothetical protein